jgi:hypothetical protein
MSGEITASQVGALRDEAGQHGDLEQAAICEQALGGDFTAWAICVEVISYAARESRP